MNDNYENRTMQSLDDIITGKSVVSNDNANLANFLSSDKWPYSLSDYLKGYIGKKVKVNYMTDNGKLNVKCGKLVVTGSDFIGIQPNSTDNLLIIELNLIRCVNIINFNNN